MKRGIIYIPGLGNDKLLDPQRKVVSKWTRRWDHVLFFEPKWHEDETDDAKFKRLLKEFDALPEGYTWRVTGASAGGPISIRLFDARTDQISNLKLVCPKIKGYETIGDWYKKVAPGFADQVKKSQEILKSIDSSLLARVKIYKPIYERVVYLDDMAVPGMKVVRLPLFGHTFTIAKVLVFLLGRKRF